MFHSPVSAMVLVAEFLHKKTSIRYAEDSQNDPPNLPVFRSPDFLLLHRVGFQNSYQPFEPYSQTDGVGIHYKMDETPDRSITLRGTAPAIFTP